MEGRIKLPPKQTGHEGLVWESANPERLKRRGIWAESESYLGRLQGPSGQSRARGSPPGREQYRREML